jgi:hypothetical protein
MAYFYRGDDRTQIPLFCITANVDWDVASHRYVPTTCCYVNFPLTNDVFTVKDNYNIVVKRVDNTNKQHIDGINVPSSVTRADGIEGAKGTAIVHGTTTIDHVVKRRPFTQNLKNLYLQHNTSNDVNLCLVGKIYRKMFDGNKRNCRFYISHGVI